VTSDGVAPLPVAAADTEIPAFVPDCGLLAMYPPEVDTVVDAVAAPGVVTAAAIADDREVWLYPCSGAPGATAALTEAGGLTYVRVAGALTTAGAQWNGAAITFTTAAGWATADVVGPGRLTLGGVDVLRVDGGAATRKLRLKLAAP
jgi:hypothetical protein